MPRTTVDIDASVLRELKRRQRREGKSLGALISELVAPALAETRRRPDRPDDFRWNTDSMQPRVDLEDKDAVQAILDRD